MSIIRGLLLRLLLVVCIILGVVFFALTTNQGLKLTLGVANIFTPGKITVKKLQGSIWHGFSCADLIYANHKQKIDLYDISLKWHLISIYPFQLAIDNFAIQQMQLHNEEQKLKINNLHLNGKLQKNLLLTGRVDIDLAQEVLQIDILTKNNIINGNFRLGANKATLHGSFLGPWHIDANLPNLGQIHESLKNLKSTLTLDATIKDKKNAILNAKLSPGHYQLPQNNKIQVIAFNGLTLQSELKSALLTLNAFAELDENTNGFINMTLPKVNFDNLISGQQAFTSTIKVHINSLHFLEGIYDLGELTFNVQNPDGILKAEVDISGFFKEPQLNGKISLANGKLELPELGIKINPAEFTVTSNGTSWNVTGLIKSTDSTSLTLAGRGKISPALSGTLTCDGNGFLTINTPEYLVKSSPHISLNFANNMFSVNGKILIPEAKITPLSFLNSQKLTGDAVFTENKEPEPLNLDMNIALAMGKDVKINAYGISGNIDGAIQIEQKPKQTLNLIGKLNLQNGKYEYYGQKLKIEKGEVIFLGKQIDNPNIQVRATRKFNNASAQTISSNKLLDFSAENLDTTNFGDQTKVGISVTGRIKSPNIKLYSNPATLSQEDILSLLLFGKRADQIGSSGGQILIKALSAMNIGSDNKAIKMLKKYKKSLGVDIDVQNQTFGTTNNDFAKTQVSIGKSITKRIYLKYSDGLFQENAGVFTLTYLLNKFLSIKVTDSDVGNGIDITYEHSE